ncbi:unnamed protein product [Phaedon cochleariae]|uniref:Right handed beta helix domain-containing protein n=1 Tax=Phaedon cochleariae TaxID=80249 RepID=A0A9N9X2W3_PHACE|nr:unnamed protein product [Phaedon cochleariae]
MGGKEIIIASKTFNAMPGLTLIYINGTKKIVMETKSFYNINSSSLLIQMQNCDEIIIKTGAFEYIQSSVSTELFDIGYITIEQAAFSKLYNSTFKNVREIKFHEKSFDFKNQGNIGRHGPVTVIIFDNVGIPEIPREVFLKPLASISFRNSNIGVIHSEAFKAAEIASIVMVDTNIGEIRGGAFTDRTLICDFKISKCTISKLDNKSIMAAIGNFSMNHSIVTDIESKAITSTIANFEVVGNHIVNIQTSGFNIMNWNRIVMDHNIIIHLHSGFIEASHGTDIEKMSFKGNEIHRIEDGAFSFISQVENKFLIFDDNFFNKSCNCSIDKWIESITNNSGKNELVMDTSFCTVDDFLSRCFSLPVGIINIQNFTKTACTNFTVCEPYEGKTRIVNTTSKIFIPEDDSEKQSWLIFMITIIGLFIVAIIVTFIILLVRGSRWLKEKGCFRNVHYNNNELSNEEEGTIVTMDENEKLDIPEELTLEFLQVLSKRLDDPNTHQEASEMIERLYEMFIIDDAYENNNRQEEEAHLYEELGNLNLQIPPPPYEEEKETSNGARSILKLMEEKFNNLQTGEREPNEQKPALVGEYSEPTDAAVHLYSELKNKSERIDAKNSNDTVKSNGSTTLRPLPEKPSDEKLLIQAGPSYRL